MKDDRGELDLTSLAEQHAKEIWALKEQISDQSKELTVLRGTKDVVVRLTNELVRMKKRAEEAESALANLLEVDGSHQKLNGKLQVRLTEVEEDNKKLSQQIDDFLNKFRKEGL
jgi:predicted  nucleic acid-binding Zn-ribbon protein